MGWVRDHQARAPAVTAVAVASVATAAYLARRAALRARAAAERDRRPELAPAPDGAAAMPARRPPLRPRLARAVVRAGALATLAASVAVPLMRHRYRIPPAATVAATAAGPLALSVMFPRTRTRDAAMYVLQMWAFAMVHELPYDNPTALRRRLRINYPIKLDRLLGGGELPNVWLQRRLARPGRVGPLDRVLTLVHWAWFLEPHLVLGWILIRDDERFPSAARQMAAVYDLGCATYFAVPTAPPWWASEQGETPAPVRRLMSEAGQAMLGDSWGPLYRLAGGNPWAAMPSLHFSSSVLAAMLLRDSDPRAGAVGWAYALSLGLALVHLGEHYVTDLLAGLALVAIVRRGEPLAEPIALRISALAQRLERIANHQGELDAGWQTQALPSRPTVEEYVRESKRG